MRVVESSEKYLVRNTTVNQREEIRDSALGYSVLDSKEPSDEVKEKVNDYVEGKVELSEILEQTIKRYQR